MKVGKIVSMCLSLLLPALLYTYYYPWLYNKINNYTERGEDLNEVDLLNVFIVFFTCNILNVIQINIKPVIHVCSSSEIFG